MISLNNKASYLIVLSSPVVLMKFFRSFQCQFQIILTVVALMIGSGLKILEDVWVCVEHRCRSPTQNQSFKAVVETPSLLRAQMYTKAKLGKILHWQNKRIWSIVGQKVCQVSNQCPPLSFSSPSTPFSSLLSFPVPVSFRSQKVVCSQGSYVISKKLRHLRCDNHVLQSMTSGTKLMNNVLQNAPLQKEE